jgi:hypothetical protein
MKHLAEFKRFLTENVKNNNVLLSSKVIRNNTSELVKENPPAPIELVQSNAFAVRRDDKISWVEFGKAKDWEFYGEEEADLKAKHNTRPNDERFTHIIFTIHKS